MYEISHIKHTTGVEGKYEKSRTYQRECCLLLFVTVCADKMFCTALWYNGSCFVKVRYKCS